MEIKKNISPDESTIQKEIKNTFFINDDINNSNSFSIKKKKDKYLSFVSSNLENIKGIFEERFFLHPNESINFLGSKHYRYNKLNICLLFLSTEVYFSIIINRFGDIATFLLNHYPQKDFSSRKFNNSDPGLNNLHKIMDNFFQNIFQSMNTTNCREHFYNVFELYLKNSFQFIDGELIQFNNQIMHKINLLGIVQFFLLVDDYENFLGIFSAKNKKSLKNKILRILKFGDCKLNMKFI